MAQTYKPTKAEQTRITMLADRMDKMKRFRQRYETDWRDAEKQREMVRDARKKDDWRADLKLPDTFSVIETAKSEMADQTPRLYYQPREPGDTIKAEKLTRIFEYTWEKGNGDVEIIKLIDDALTYGLGIGEEYYRQDIQDEKAVEEFDMDKFQPVKWESKEVIKFEDVYFESLPIWCFYWDPMADSLTNARDCAKVLLYTHSEFERRFRKYPNSKVVTPQGGSVFRTENYHPVGNHDDNEVEVIYYYDKRADLFLIQANGVLLTDPDNPIPYKHKDFPFVRAVDILIPHRFPGLGEPKVMKALQEERNSIRNMRLDTSHLNIQTQYIVDDRLEMDDEDLVARPHGIIRGPIDAIKPVDKIPVFAEAYKEEEYLNDDIIKTTGIDIRMQGLGDTNSTATEVALVKESSLKRIRLKLRLLEKMTLNRIGRLRLANVQQFYSIPKVKRILGGDGQIEEVDSFRDIGYKHQSGSYEWFTANPEDITGEFDTMVVAGATLPVSKELDAQKAINTFDRLVGNPEVNQRELVKMLIDTQSIRSFDATKLLAKPYAVSPNGAEPESQNPLATLMGGQQAPTAMPPVGVNMSAGKVPKAGNAMAGNTAK